MPVNALLDADTETFEAGPYNRAVRVRKWVYLFAGATLIVSHGWFADSGLLSWLGVSRIPTAAIWQAVTLSLAYFTFQYLLVGGQVLSLYSRTLETRLGEKTKADLRRIEKELGQLQIINVEARRQFDLEAKQLNQRISEAEQAGDDFERRIQEAALHRLDSSLSSAQSARDEQLDELNRELKVTVRSNLTRRPGVRAFEIALDIWRLWPPAIVGAVVLFRFGHIGL